MYLISFLYQKIQVGKTHRILCKNGYYYPQQKHSWHFFWRFYEKIEVANLPSGEFVSVKNGKLKFQNLNETVLFIKNLAWYN